jgi:proliferating cell nuclear antigen
MVEIEFSEAGLFRRIIDSLKGLVEDITFDCGPKGMSLQAMDASHISLIAMGLPAEIFSRYECREPTSLSFSVETLLKIMKGSKPTDSLTIRAADDEEDIEMSLVSSNQEKSAKFHLKRVDAQGETVAIPDHVYRAVLTMSSDGMNQLVKSLSDISETVMVRCSPGQITFSVVDALVRAETTFSAGVVCENAQDEVEVEVSEACHISYALRYLKAISTASALSSRVSLSFSPHFPLLVDYELCEDGFMRFYLAPKVEESSDGEEL